MRATIALIAVALVIVGVSGHALAADLKDKVKVAIESVGVHPGMDPGMYVCALGHLHIKGTVENLAGVALGKIKLAGRAFDADGKLLGTATSFAKQSTLGPGEKAEINLEFLTVMGPRIQAVKKHEVTVVEAPTKE